MSDMRSGARSGPAPDSRCTGVYRRRRPAPTILYQVVQCHLESWLAQHREAEPDHDPIPWYVERDYRRYLDCGLLCCGFGRARCKACGHDFLLAFSCSGRGVCPSCTTRDMAETAAHLVDHVFPQVPVAAPAHPALAALMHPCMSRRRGRDGPLGPPPAQNPACRTTAPGSHLGWWRRSARSARDAGCERRAASAPQDGSSVSRWCGRSGYGAEAHDASAA